MLKGTNSNQTAKTAGFAKRIFNSSALFFIFSLFLMTGNTKAQGCCGHDHKAGVSDSTGVKTEHHEMDESPETFTDTNIDNNNDSNEIAWNAVCPVMGNEIDPEANTVEYEGKVYGFCCNGCDKKFRKDPTKYSSNLSEDGKEFIGNKEKH